MSIQSEITRIESAKTAIATAIEGKGVTVPDGTLLDGMASLIESIEAGGVGNVVFGSFVLSDSSEIIIENAFQYDYAPEIFGVCEFSPSLKHSDTSHTVIRLNSLIAKGYNTIKDPTYNYSINYSSAGQFTRRISSDIYSSFTSTFRVGNSLYNFMEGIIDGSTRNLRFKPLSDGGGFIAGRTYYYFLIFRS